MYIMGGNGHNHAYCELLSLRVIQYTDAGLYTCSSGERPYNIPGSYGHYDQDAKTFTDWGVECKQLKHIES